MGKCRVGRASTLGPIAGNSASWHNAEVAPDEEWRMKTYAYVNDVNEFVERGLRLGWDKAGSDPVNRDRSHLADAAISAVRAANAKGDFDGLRDQWPPAHIPLIAYLKEGGQSIPALIVLDDGSIIARIGNTHSENSSTVHIHGDEVTQLPDIGLFGAGPNGRFIAFAEPDGVRITDGWGGPTSSICRWPTGQEGAPEGAPVEKIETPPSVDSLVPFPDGLRVLSIGSDGVFVLTTDVAHRLIPSEDGIADHVKWRLEEDVGQPLNLSADMAHGAVSGDGKWIAVGSQDGPHLVFDAELVLAASVGHASEYPTMRCSVRTAKRLRSTLAISIAAAR